MDNIVYLLGWADSRAEARQLVTHGHFCVNGSKVDIPSYLCKPGDAISIKEKSASTDSFKNILEANGARPVPTWLERNSDANTAKVINLPEREQIEAPIEEHLIVEFYSK